MRSPRLPRSLQLSIALLMLGVSAATYLSGCETNGPAPTLDVANPAGPGEYLFCFWNVENLFDDKNDGRNGQGDKEYDAWLSQNPDILKQKLAKLSDALLSLNSGKGPDILAICEVEGVRAADLLRQTLNARLADPALHYHSLLMKEVTVGRHIAPAILTRLPAVKDHTRGFGSRFRIVEGHLMVEGHKLIVLASHWTSRLQEGDKGRREYADKIYGQANAIYHGDPTADVLVCGDFNDTPSDPSVTENLRATGDLTAIKAAGQHLRLFHLQAGKNPNAGFGTHYYNGWHIFDHLVVSPGLLDSKGWSCDPGSVAVARNLARPDDAKGRPWRFGGEKDAGPRGYSDHFPVTVTLRVAR